MKIIEGQCFDEERSLYALRETAVKNCIFAGKADGESVLKECSNIDVESCSFSLRYPLWHATDLKLCGSHMDSASRAPIWYCSNGLISDCEINGIKALRECKNIKISKSKIVSSEFAWKCDGITVSDCDISSEYLFLDSNNVRLTDVKMQGKYSFQYMHNLHIENCVLNTKDAFWHSENVTVENSVVNGEYLGWFSKGLTLISCRISGTQPLCYCENLRLVDCTMENTDLSFEYSDVCADVKGTVMSVKNPRSGYIKADGIGEIILENSVMQSDCKIILNK